MNSYFSIIFPVVSDFLHSGLYLSAWCFLSWIIPINPLGFSSPRGSALRISLWSFLLFLPTLQPLDFLKDINGNKERTSAVQVNSKYIHLMILDYWLQRKLSSAELPHNVCWHKLSRTLCWQSSEKPRCLGSTHRRRNYEAGTSHWVRHFTQPL